MPLLMKDKSPAFESWPIVRSRPVGKTFGRSISLFIDNMHCYLTTVDAYEDGSIDCWEFVDRSLFKAKLDESWVVSSPRKGQLLSVFHFDVAQVNDGKWFQTRSSVMDEVDATIRSLNPSMRDLIDMQGSNVELRGKVRTAKMGLSDKKAYRIGETTGGVILADDVPILRLANDNFELTRLFIFADGMLRIGPDGDLFPLETLPLRFAEGALSNQAPAGSLVRLPGLGEFRPSEAFGRVSIPDRIAEVRDLHDKLNGGFGVVRRCAQAFEKYRREPSPEMKDALRSAYEAVPEHLRRYCGDMDTRDTAIRKVLFG